jgi:transcriptional regulator with XRE-family HTH domain
VNNIKAEVRELHLGEKIRKLRQERRLTLQEVADLTGLSKPLLSQIENDQVTPPLATLLKISKGLRVGIHFFFEDEGDRRKFVLIRGEEGALSQRRPKSDAPQGYRYRSLAPGLRQKQIEPFLVEFELKEWDDSHFYNHEGEDGGPNREVKLTDGGRTVYGGGGITPDVKIPPVKSTHLQESLLQHYAFFNFAKHYTVAHHPEKDMVVDEALLLEFRKYLDDEKVAFTEPEFNEVVDWVKANIKAEIMTDLYGQEEGLKSRAQWDPQINKCLELLPKAKELAENAKHMVAQRQGAASMVR